MVGALVNTRDPGVEREEGIPMDMIARIAELDIDPYATENLLDPYPMHERMREAGPVARVIACARYQQVRHVLTNPATFISGAGVGLPNFNQEAPFRPKSPILEADPPQHTQARAVLSRILSPSVAAQVRAEFTARAKEMVERCVELGEIDGMADLARAYPLKVFPDAVGLPCDGRDNLPLYTDMVLNALGPRNALFEKSVQRVVPVTQWIMTHCRRDRLSPGGFGDQVYQAAEAGEITFEQATLLVRSLLGAGVDTTIAALGNALYALAHHPAEYAKLHGEPALARYAFEETLRWESTAQTFYRTAAHDCEIAGVSVSENSKVLCMLAAANRDPRKWLHPDHFCIERNSRSHMGFGVGIHVCVGQAIARLEGEVLLTAIAKRVKRIEPNGAHRRRLNNTMRAFDTLPLRLTAA